MDYFNYYDGRLHAEDVAIEEIARSVGTPFYCYSRRTIREHYSRLSKAFSGVDLLVAYSVKASGSLAILEMMKSEGSGFDIVSGGELFRVSKIGADPKKTVFAGVGKTKKEIEEALDWGIGWFNVESGPELARIADIAAERGVQARCAIRVNPDVDPGTHRHITTGKRENKFGMDFETARKLFSEYLNSESVSLSGIHMHIGSQITKVEPYVEALGRVVRFISQVREEGSVIESINLGGGYGIFYHGDEALEAEEFGEKLIPLVKEADCTLIIEPGRFIMGNSGIIVSEVQYVKKTDARTFVILDTGMHHLIRPALYDGYHKIGPVRQDENAAKITVDVVGPICESSDFLAKDREIQEVGQGDLVAIFSAGAYGFSMTTEYNSQPKPAEVMVDGAEFRVIRERGTYEDLIRGESILSGD